MIRKMIICAVIALILVPAGVLAAGYGGQNAGTGSGQGQCLYDGANCADNSGAAGSGTQMQYRYGSQKNGEAGCHGIQGGRGANGMTQSPSRNCLHDGSCSGCQNAPVTQS